MPKFDEYPAQTTPDDDDIIIVKSAVSGVTKKIKKSDLFKEISSVTVLETESSLSPITPKTFITALASGITINDINALLKVDGQPIIIRIKDNGTSRAITISSSYRAVGVTLPTATTINKTLYIGGLYNSAASKVDIIAVARES